MPVSQDDPCNHERGKPNLRVEMEKLRAHIAQGLVSKTWSLPEMGIGDSITTSEAHMSDTEITRFRTHQHAQAETTEHAVAFARIKAHLCDIGLISESTTTERITDIALSLMQGCVQLSNTEPSQDG